MPLQNQGSDLPLQYISSNQTSFVQKPERLKPNKNNTSIMGNFNPMIALETYENNNFGHH
jgi:hypothetical protein